MARRCAVATTLRSVHRCCENQTAEQTAAEAPHRPYIAPLETLAACFGIKVTQRHVRPSVRVPFRSQERSEEHTSELQSLMRISYAVFCLKKKKNKQRDTTNHHRNLINNNYETHRTN